MKKIFSIAVIALAVSVSAGATAAEPAYKAGDKVKVEWKGGWYDAVVKSFNVSKKCFQIHYDNYSDSWDECVSKKRIKDR